MPDFVISAPLCPSLAILDQTARFPLRRIFCVGRNYAAHIREMGNDLREPPFYFTKPADALVESGATIPYPPATEDLHHEVELVLAIGKAGSQITQAQAPAYIWGSGVGIDLTRRDLQAAAKQAGRPWDMAKGFDRSAPIGPLRAGPPPPTGAITLDVNGTRRQSGDLAQMIWSATECVAHLSTLVTLLPGDLIMTGTPSGVGPLVPGDQVHAEIEGLAPVDLHLAAR